MTDRQPFISVILLAGGIGSRMQAALPKQFMPLEGKPIALYSFDVFVSLPEVAEIIVVCDPSYQFLFINPRPDLRLAFAPPGALRQDSVYNGFRQIGGSKGLVCIHDSARPFISAELVRSVLAAADEVGAAALGMPIKFTVKECNTAGWVQKTPSRDTLWEIQTPQVVRADLLQKGFDQAQALKLTVTDDVSLVELLSHPVKIVKGSYENIKITTPEDMLLSEGVLRKSYGKNAL